MSTFYRNNLESDSLTDTLLTVTYITRMPPFLLPRHLRSINEDDDEKEIGPSTAISEP